MRRALKAFVCSVLMVAGLLVAAPAASAGGTSMCSSSGGLGRICVYPQSNGHYNAVYTNTTNGSRYVDFNLQVRGRTPDFGDQGAFTVAKGGQRSYVFQIGLNNSCARLKLYDQTGTYPALVTGYTC